MEEEKNEIQGELPGIEKAKDIPVGIVVFRRIFLLWLIPSRVYKIKDSKATDKNGITTVIKEFADLIGERRYEIVVNPGGYSVWRKIPMVNVAVKEEHGHLTFTLW